MEMNLYIWSVILGGAVVTILPRIMPISILSTIKINEKVSKALSYVPISILSALVAAELFTFNNAISLSGRKIELLAAIPTVIVSLKTNNLLITVIVGVASAAVLRLIF